MKLDCRNAMFRQALPSQSPALAPPIRKRYSRPTTLSRTRIILTTRQLQLSHASPPSISLVMVTISEVKGNSRENRTAAHTHIKGLGLRSDGYAENNINSGFFGQLAAREVRPSQLALIGSQRQTQLMLVNDKRHAALWWTSSSLRRCQVVQSY